MPAAVCTECGAHVAIDGATNCPRCNGRLQNPTDTHPAQFASASSAMGFSAWLGLLALGVIVALLGLIVYRLIVPSEESIRRELTVAALIKCQRAIQSVAQYGDADTPPYAQNHGKGDEFYFAWPRGSFEFANGFGAREKMSASCTGTLSTGEIKSLTINGKDII